MFFIQYTHTTHKNNMHTHLYYNRNDFYKNRSTIRHFLCMHSFFSVLLQLQQHLQKSITTCIILSIRPFLSVLLLLLIITTTTPSTTTTTTATKVTTSFFKHAPVFLCLEGNSYRNSDYSPHCQDKMPECWKILGLFDGLIDGPEIFAGGFQK